MLLGLSAVTIGNGFFKPNISTMVGSLYATGDRRRDAGFTIFYMGINLGSLFSQILCPILAVGIPGVWAGLGWWAGFGLAAIGMAVSWGLIQFAGPGMTGIGETPVAATGGSDRTLLIYVAGAAGDPAGLVPVFEPDGRPAAGQGRGLRRLSARPADFGQGAVLDLPRRGHRHPDLGAARRHPARSSR